MGNSVAYELQALRDAERPLQWEYMNVLDPDTVTFRELGLHGWEAYAVTSVPRTAEGDFVSIITKVYFKRLVRHG